MASVHILIQSCSLFDTGRTVGGMVTYMHGHHESVLRSHTWRTAANSAGYLLGQLDAGMSLLDVGCGLALAVSGSAQRCRR